MIPLFFLILSLTVLFLISYHLKINLYRLFYRLTKNHLLSVRLLALTLLPGTIIHEGSHLIAALALNVPTGQITIFPEIPREDTDSTKLGSLKMAQTDPFRHTLIGLAPFFFGIISIISIFLLYFNLNLKSPGLDHFIGNLQLSFQNNPAGFIFFSYLLFSVSNSMFSSAQDLVAAGLPFLSTLVLAITLFLIKDVFSLPPTLLLQLKNLLNVLVITFLLTIILDTFCLLLTIFLKKFLPLPA
jgi:hypothetical protein